MLPGPTELALILVIVLILFGAGKLPQVFEAFGQGIKKFREAQQEDPDDVTPASRPPGKISATPRQADPAEVEEVVAEHKAR